MAKKKPYLEIYEIMNEEEKCYEVGLKYHNNLKIDLEDIRIKRIWTIGALKCFISQIINKCVEVGIKVIFYPELRKKGE